MCLKPFLHQKAFVNVSLWLMNSQDEVKQQIIQVYKDYHVSQKVFLVIIVFFFIVIRVTGEVFELLFNDTYTSIDCT